MADFLVKKAPFTSDEVDSINAFQQSGIFHPFTCGGGDRTSHPDGEGRLVAVEAGVKCPYCDYTQNWVRFHG